MSLKIGDTIELQRFCPNPENPGNTFDGLAAKVLEIYPDGVVRAEIIYPSEDYSIPQYVMLQPGTYRPAALYSFDVTVIRYGYVDGILATNAAQAMAAVNRSISYDDVDWAEDWPATDAQRKNDSRRI